MSNDAKRAAQDALFTAIKSQAETNMKAALRATEKAEILRALAEAYRLAAGGPASEGAVRRGKPEEASRRGGKPDEERPRRRRHEDDRPRRVSAVR
jgi:hypothetical protein